VRIKLLLDEHIDPEAASALRRELPGLDARSIFDTDWQGLADPPLLEILDAEGRTLVTRDVNSVPRHVASRLRAGKTHRGVIYVDSKRLRPTDLRGLIRRLGEVLMRHGNEDWRCRQGWL
jgi:hypothetical protein